MHQWYWSYPNPDFLDSEFESIEFDSLYEESNGIGFESSNNYDPLFADLCASEIISPSSSATNYDITERVDSNLLETIHNKIKSQLDYNSRMNRTLMIYSEHFPTNMQLNGHEIANLHRHLLSLDESYILRRFDNVNFRMFRTPTIHHALRPTEELLRHVDD